ncbi:MAG: alpha/beta hydrolase [Phycisphaerales bacterium]|nr:MAG: alpha/beta hydrolase [Phycisphaerales bacterium]
MKRNIAQKMTFFVLVLSLVEATSADVRAPDSWRGHWAGWAYGEGMDFPLRLNVDGDDAVRFFTPVAAAMLQAPTEIDGTGAGWVVLGETAKGGTYELNVRLIDRWLVGSGSINGSLSFTFELLPAAVSLEYEPVDDAAPLIPEGDYVGKNGDLIVVHNRSWGEVIIEHDSVGRTAFWTSPDTFVLGPALYAINEVTATGAIERSSAGDITALHLTGEEIDFHGRPVKFPEHEITGEGDGGVLHGNLIMPGGAGPFPAVIIIGGSEWQTGDEWRHWAKQFAAMGIAALVYDKAGYGESEGDRLEWFVQTARDAAVMAAAVRSRPDVRDDAVGVAGISRGGWTAPLAAVIDEDISFVIGFVAPAVSPEEQETTRRLNELADELESAGDRELARRYLEALSDYAASGDNWERYAELRLAVDERGWLDVLGGSDDRYDPEWAWSRLNRRYDPVPVIEQLSCPVLVVLAGADSNVTLQDNEPRWRRALERAPTNVWRIEVIAGSDHGYRLGGLLAGREARIHDAVGWSPLVWSAVRKWADEVRQGQRWDE